MSVQPVGAGRALGGTEPGGPAARARLRPLLVPVAAAGIVVVAAGFLGVSADLPRPSELAGIFALLLAGLLAEAYPLPVEKLPTGSVSLADVFFVGTALLFGTPEAILAAVIVRLTVDLTQRKPKVRVVYNCAVYALSAGAAGVAASAVGSETVAQLVLQVLSAAAAYYVVNVTLVAGALSRWNGQSFLPLLSATTYWTALPFAIMASGTLMLAVLWERSPFLTLALVGPLLAVALYQRSVTKALVATRLALTDGLTGLGNQGHFHERLEHELDDAEARGTTLSLCLLDVDGMKRVNDTLGHPVGDRLLREVAAVLRHGGEAFRVGGDEFALLLPRIDAEEALRTAETVVGRMSTIEVAGRSEARVSAGLAIFPPHCRERSELYRAADDALYASKREGLNRVHVYRPDDRRPLGAAAEAS
jgi:diguanylate cyclase (GGDEF)-like protein